VLAKGAADRLITLIKRARVIGISGGRTAGFLIQEICQRDFTIRDRDRLVCSLVPEPIDNDLSDPAHTSTALAHQLATKMNADCLPLIGVPFCAPLGLDDEQTTAFLNAFSRIRRYESAKNAWENEMDCAIVSAGGVESTAWTIHEQRAAYLGLDQPTWKRYVLGDFAGRLFPTDDAEAQEAIERID
jgi:DNA-binding transcriptional regulator LsrR (DeoR family)